MNEPVANKNAWLPPVCWEYGYEDTIPTKFVSVSFFSGSLILSLHLEYSGVDFIDPFRPATKGVIFISTVNLQVWGEDWKGTHSQTFHTQY